MGTHLPIIKEYRCLDCGDAFETADPDPCCPACSGEGERAFFTPPGIRSPSTKVKDQMVRGLAADYGLSDVNNRYGEAVAKRSIPKEAQPQFMGAEAVNRMGIPANARDQLSSVLPSLQAMGGPTQWHKTRERR